MSDAWCCRRHSGAICGCWNMWRKCWPSGNRGLCCLCWSSSLPGGRRPQWVYNWEEQYGWPVHHHDDNGDLAGLERTYYYDNLEPFNQRQPTVQRHPCQPVRMEPCAVRRAHAGRMGFADIRRGTDVEFGQSIYEPFGIAQMEALAYGALSCVASMCGCIGFATRAAAGGAVAPPARLPNLVVADYVTLPQGYWLGSPYDALGIDQGIRDWIEGNNSERAAHMLLARLPQNDEQGTGAAGERLCGSAGDELGSRGARLFPACPRSGRQNIEQQTCQGGDCEQQEDDPTRGTPSTGTRRRRRQKRRMRLPNS